MHPSKFTPIIIGTTVMTGISIFPFINLINILCCAGIIIGAVIGTGYYNSQLRKINETIQFKDGAAIGILSGILSALLTVIILTLMTIALKDNPIPMILDILDKQAITLPPSAERLLEKISNEYNNNGFSITLTTFNLVFHIIIYPLFGFLGGMLEVSIINKRNRN